MADLGAQHIAQALESNATLREIHLKGMCPLTLFVARLSDVIQT